MRSSNYSPAGERGLFRRDRRLFLNSGTWTWTIPDGVTKVWAFCMGAGGGGPTYGTANTNNFGVLGGGKGGGYASGVISGLTPGGTLTLTIGEGGLGSYRGATAGNGGNTTVALTGGSTYLTGNGGGGGSNTPVTSDNGSQKGQGGSASTSGVTDAYTAAGGGSGNYPAGVGYSGITTSNISTVTGGGASGSPFGTGMGGGKSVAAQKSPTGGGGWTQEDYRHPHAVQSSSGETMMEGGYFCGYGSHEYPAPFAKSATAWFGTGGKGGKGLTAQGGLSLSLNNWFASYLGADLVGSRIVDIQKELLDGENGNPDWWFPWEIDGGGGGSVYHTNSAGSWTVTGGQGGPGAGGGGAGGYGSNNCISRAGRGGFGGGGGGARVSATTINYWIYSVGGDGGNGGGGGGAWGRIESSKYMPVGGNGGDGAVGLYW